VLGCTGAVGQRFVQYLDQHPWFDVVALAASDKSAGKRYDEATRWQPTSDVPDYAKSARVVRCIPSDMPDVDLVFSALVSTLPSLMCIASLH
jgi:aspartate-semialdehyde dehydrogenase